MPHVKSNQIKSSFFQINQIKSTGHLDNWLVVEIDKIISIMSYSTTEKERIDNLPEHNKILF